MLRVLALFSLSYMAVAVASLYGRERTATDGADVQLKSFATMAEFRDQLIPRFAKRANHELNLDWMVRN